MTQYVNEYDEALNALTGGILDTSDIEPYMGAIVGALKKQIPIKPEPLPRVAEMEYYWYCCPTCHMGIDRHSSCCEVCGQMIDWEE